MEQRIPTVYKLLAAAVLIPLAAALALTVALRVWFPPERLRGLLAAEASRYLHREVRLKSASWGLFRGLLIEGLEVSEKPDFKAGSFAGVASFRFRVQWLPLLHKAVVIDEITVAGPSLAVVQLKPGVFNFSDLLVPAPEPAAKPASAAAGAGLPFALQASVISLKDGRVSYEDRVSGMRWQLSELGGRIKDLSLIAPFGMEGGLQARELAPGSLKAKADFSAELDLSGLASGKLSADVHDLTLNLAGLTVKLAGPVRLSPDRVETGALKGRLGGGTLSLQASVLDFSRAPDARLEAGVSELDAAKLLEVKAAFAGQAPPPAPSRGGARPAAAAPAGPAMKSSGKLTVDKILYHSFKAQNLVMTWDLKGITPDLRGLSGWAKLDVGGGTFEPAQSGDRGPLMKALLIPLNVLKQVGQAGAALRILPPFDKIVFSEVKGDYGFARGLMTVREFHLRGAVADVRAGGTVDLPGQKLALKVIVALANVAPVPVDVGGTFDHPTTSLRLDKVLAPAVNKLKPAVDNLLKGLFKGK